MNEKNTERYNYNGTIIEVSKEIKDYLEEDDKKMFNALTKRKRPSSYTKADGRLVRLSPLETYISDIEARNYQIPDKDSGNIDYQDLKLVIAEVLDKLDSEEKYIIEMSYFHKMREKEIAKELGVYPYAVQYKKRKALKKIRIFLGNKNPLEE